MWLDTSQAKKYNMWERVKFSCLPIVEMSVARAVKWMWTERGYPSESGEVKADVSSVGD
jgi:hypothetical protein